MLENAVKRGRNRVWEINYDSRLVGNDGLTWVIVVEIDGTGYIQVILKVELTKL